MLPDPRAKWSTSAIEVPNTCVDAKVQKHTCNRSLVHTNPCRVLGTNCTTAEILDKFSPRIIIFSHEQKSVFQKFVGTSLNEGKVLGGKLI